MPEELDEILSCCRLCAHRPCFGCFKRVQRFLLIRCGTRCLYSGTSSIHKCQGQSLFKKWALPFLSIVNVTQIPVHRRDRGLPARLQSQVSSTTDSLEAAHLLSPTSPPWIPLLILRLTCLEGVQVESVMSEFDIFVFLNRWRRGLSDHGFASSVVDINVSFLPEMAGHVCQTGYTITGLVSAATPWEALS